MSKTSKRQHQKHQPYGSFYILNCHWPHTIVNGDKCYGSVVDDEKTTKQKHYVICAVHAISIAWNGRLFDTNSLTHSLTRSLKCSMFTAYKYKMPRKLWDSDRRSALNSIDYCHIDLDENNFMSYLVVYLFAVVVHGIILAWWNCKFNGLFGNRIDHHNCLAPEQRASLSLYLFLYGVSWL